MNVEADCLIINRLFMNALFPPFMLLYIKTLCWIGKTSVFEIYST